MTDPNPSEIADRRRRLQRVARVARLMDTAVRIPGTGISFGGDAIVGLVPGLGDAAGGLVSLYIVNEARRLGMPSHKLVKMLGNIGLDFAVGSVPLLGDMFDVMFKANRRNLEVILEHFGEDGFSRVDDVDPAAMKDVTPRRRTA